MAIDTAFVKQFGSTLEMLVQQKGSRLRNCVRVESVTGEEAYFDQLSSTTAVAKTARNQDTPLVKSDFARRRVSLTDWEWADLIDKEDKLKMLVDPDSTIAQNAANALGRAIDQALIDAFSGTAYTGKAGGTSTSFTSGNQIAAASANLTLAKIISAKVKLDAGNVDPDEPRYMAVTASQVGAMLNISNITSADYNTIKALVAGDVNTFCGFEFKKTELLTKNSSTRTCLAWAKSGMLLALQSDIKTEITRRADKSYATQVYASMSIGATRMQEAKCVEIACIES
jgi:hypothetical protein